MNIHAHHHHHSAPDPIPGEGGTSRAFTAGILLNTGFVVLEFAAGFMFNSMGLLADAGHNLGDVGGLLISLTAFLLAKKRRTEHYTYGFRKATILASLLNAVILFAAVGAILVECVRKFAHPAPVAGSAVMITAGVGILVNGITVFLFRKGREHDLNIKGAYLHMLADTLVSVGVVASGALILWTGWTVIDPLVGFLIAFAILGSAWGLMRESIRLSMDGVPEGIKPEEIREHLLEVPNVLNVHHIHVWPISTTETALTAHVVLGDLSRLEESKIALRKELSEHGNTHSTLEFESGAIHCADADI